MKFPGKGVLSLILLPLVIHAAAPDPKRFRIEVLATGLQDPMEIAPMESGDVLIIEKGGTIKRLSQADQSLITIGVVPVHNAVELGLLGIEPELNFEKTRRLFLFFCPKENPGTLRLSRFSLGENFSLMNDSEEILFDYLIDVDGAIHMGGGLVMNPNTGNLWIGTGDNCPPIPELPVDVSIEGRLRDALRSSANSQDLRGKVLRIHPLPDSGYSIPGGNLFKNPIEGRGEIFAMGVRNAFRFAVDPETGRVAWGDVGQNIDPDTNVGPNGYDEINVTQNAGNFGWPMFTGPNEPYRSFNYKTRLAGQLFDSERPFNNSPRNTGLEILPSPVPAAIWYPSGVSESFPILGSGGRSAMAGPFFYVDPQISNATKMPDYYDGCLFIHDWTRNWIMSVRLNPDNSVESIEPFVPHLRFRKPIHLSLTNDHSMLILEFGDRWGGNKDGQLIRLNYHHGNLEPVASFTMSAEAGEVPLKVKFDAESSIDPDGELSEYKWTMDDRRFSGKSVEHEFTRPGEYTVELKVTDSDGKSSRFVRTLSAGNHLPLIKILEPQNGGFFDDGEPVPVRIQIDDKEDGSSARDEIDKSRISIQGTYSGVRGNGDIHPGLKLMRSTTCFSCHLTHSKSLGPPYRLVSEKYAGLIDIREKLAVSIVEGSVGKWSQQIPMPPHPHHTLSEARMMTDWILSIAESSPDDVIRNTEGILETPEAINGLEQGGKYGVTARYTDHGSEGVRPSAGETTHILHARKRKAALHDESHKVDVIDVFEGGEGLVARIGEEGWVRWSAVRIEGNGAVELRLRAALDRPARLQIRANAKDGLLLAESPVIQPDDRFTTATFPILDPGRVTDLILCAGDAAIEVNWCRFIEGMHLDTSVPALTPAVVQNESIPPPRSRRTVEKLLNPDPGLKTEKQREIFRIVLCASPKDGGHKGPGFHDYPIWQARWSAILSEVEGVNVETAQGWPSKSQLNTADVIAFFHDNPKWEKNKAADLDSVFERGGGLVFLHWSCNSYRDPEPLQNRLGLIWSGSCRWRRGIIEYEYSPHVIAEGFPEKDGLIEESYWNLKGDLKGFDLVSSVVEEDESRPQVWAGEKGNGRIVVCIPGHFTWTHDDPLYRILVYRSLCWAAKRPLNSLDSAVFQGARYVD